MKKKAKVANKAPVASAPRRTMRFSDEFMVQARKKRRGVDDHQKAADIFKPYVHPAAITKDAPMAMDDAFSGISEWAGGGGIGNFSAVFGNGRDGFLGYPELARLALRAENRNGVETIATECTRRWIKIQAKGETDKTKRIDELETALIQLAARDHCRKLCEQDGYFGRSHLYIDTGATDNLKELRTPIGNGRDGTTKAKIAAKSLKCFRTVEAWLVYPIDYNSIDPLKDFWYRPKLWGAMGKELDASRLLTFIGRDVPDLLKPAYSFGGQAMTEIALPYVDNWLKVRKGVTDLITSYSVFVLKMNMASQMNASGGDESVFRRAAAFNLLRDNAGLMMIDKETEEFANVSASLAGLEALQAQAQEHMCLSGETLIETARGQIPIRDIVASDYVMTSEGFAPIEWTGCTGVATSLVEISTEHSKLRATPCHPIFLPETNEFVPAQSVKLSHRLKSSPAWVSMASPSHGEVVYGAPQKRVTNAIRKAVASFTASCGRFIRDLFQKASTYITAMKIEPTIAFQTSISSQDRIITPSTWPMEGLGSTNTRQSLIERVESAATPSQRLCRTGLSIVRPLAKQERGTCAILNIRELKARESVFNISVKEGFPPEFFANGILVHNCSVWRTPVVKLLGIQPAGLNASSKGELDSFEATIGAYQERFFRPNLTTMIDFAMLNLWGEVDEDITFVFEPLEPLNEKEIAEVDNLKAETDQIRIESGVIWPEDARTAIAANPATPYPGLDVDNVPTPPMTEAGTPFNERKTVVEPDEPGEGKPDQKKKAA